MVIRYSNNLIVQIRSIDLKDLLSFHLKCRDRDASQIIHEVFVLKKFWKELNVLLSACMLLHGDVFQQKLHRFVVSFSVSNS